MAEHTRDEQKSPTEGGSGNSTVTNTDKETSEAAMPSTINRDATVDPHSQSADVQKQGGNTGLDPSFSPNADSSNEDKAPQGGWGWAVWLPSSAVLQQAAAGALRDVQELKKSFQQALAAEDAEDDDDEESGIQHSDAEALSSSSTDESIAKRRQAVLQRLEGQENPLAAGVKALDDHVGVLADGVAGLAANFWSTARIATAQVAGQVETGLEQLGHSAIQLLDGSFEQDGLLNKGETRDMQASQLTFDFAFHACGGRETCEELEELTNKCARSCNKLRAELATDARSNIDSILTDLCPIFDLKDADREPATIQSDPEGAGTGLKTQTAIDKFLEKGMARAQVVRRSRLRLPGSVAAAETEAVRLTARLTALCIQQLLLLARFLLGCAGDAAAAHEGFEWPEAPAGKAALLRTQALHMLTALQALASAYVEALQRCTEPQTSQQAASTHSMPSQKEPSTETDKSAAGDCHEAPSSGAHEEQDTIAKHTAQEQDKEALVASSSDASAERRPQVSAKLLATGGTDTSKAVVAVMKCSATAMHVIVESFKGLLYAVLLSAEDRIVHRNMC